MPPAYRVERDPLGEVRVPAKAYYGGQTARAVANFPMSGLTAPPALVTATILVTKAAAEANRKLRRLPQALARPFARAADEILSGRLRDEFVVDVYQAGAGTSHNMNANEVPAARARELLDRSTAFATALSPHMGYAQTADIAKLAVATGRPIRDIVRERRLMPDRALEAILSPLAMTSPGRPGQRKGRR